MCECVWRHAAHRLFATLKVVDRLAIAFRAGRATATALWVAELIHGVPHTMRAEYGCVRHFFGKRGRRWGCTVLFDSHAN